MAHRRSDRCPIAFDIASEVQAQIHRIRAVMATLDCSANADPARSPLD